MGLRGEQAYKRFLNGAATFASLPSTITRVFQYQDPVRLFLDHFQEDMDPATASLAGARNSDVGTFFSRQELSFSDRGRPHFLWGESRGLIVGWEGRANPEYRIDLPPGAGSLGDYPFLAFHAGQTHEEPSRFNSPGMNQDFSVQLHFGSTVGPEVPVSNYAPLPYPVVTSPGRHYVGTTKSIQQTVRIPFADLRPEPHFRTSDVTQIVFKFNQRASGNLAIDEIQFTH